jgi:hypothetical protein
LTSLVASVNFGRDRSSWFTEMITRLGGDHMANIAKRPDRRWRALYRDLSGAEHSRHFARKVDPGQRGRRARYRQGP